MHSLNFCNCLLKPPLLLLNHKSKLSSILSVVSSENFYSPLEIDSESVKLMDISSALNLPAEIDTSFFWYIFLRNRDINIFRFLINSIPSNRYIYLWDFFWNRDIDIWYLLRDLCLGNIYFYLWIISHNDINNILYILWISVGHILKILRSSLFLPGFSVLYFPDVVLAPFIFS